MVQDGKQLIVLFGGGTKKSQPSDIKKAKKLFQEYKKRKKELNAEKKERSSQKKRKTRSLRWL